MLAVYDGGTIIARRGEVHHQGVYTAWGLGIANIGIP